MRAQDSDTATALPITLALAVALALAVWLRASQLGDQLLMGDEVWTVRAAALHSFSYLLTHHHGTDYSIPLALWDRALMGSIGLSEWGARLPVFAMGCAVPLLVWLFLRRALGALDALAATSIFAVSPILLLYSRFARPYIGVVLFILLALIGWTRWLDSGRRGWGALAAGSAALALFWNALAVPALVGLFVSGLASYFVRRSPDEEWPKPSLRSSAIVILGALLLALLLYAPSLASLLEITRDRSGTGSFTLVGVRDGLHFLLGTRLGVVLLWAVAGVAVGAARLQRTRAVLLAPLVAMFIAQATALALLAPELVEWSYVLGRYLLPGALGVLILLGLGIAQQASWIAKLATPLFGAAGAGLERAFGVAALAALVSLASCLGPLPDIVRSPNAFTSHPREYAPPVPPLVAERISPFYASLARTPMRQGSIVEVPWTRAFRFTPYAEYQRIHGRTVWSVTSDPLFEDPDLDLRGVRPLEALASTSIESDYVVIHKRVAEEMLHVIPLARGTLVQRSERTIPGQLRSLHNETVQLAKRICERNDRLRRVYEDDWLVVYGDRDAPSLAGDDPAPPATPGSPAP